MRRLAWVLIPLAACALAAWYWLRAPQAPSGSADAATAEAVVRVPEDPLLADRAHRSGGGDGASRPAPAAASPAPAVHGSQGGRATIEGALLDAHSLRAASAAALLEREDFEAVLRQLRSDSAGSALADDNTRRYGKQTADALAKRFPGIRIDGFACAESLCGLQASSRRIGDDRVFQAILDSGSAQAPFYSVVSDIRDLAGGGARYRMLFTTDPARNRLLVPPSPPSPVR